jgi:hypothetical protein
MILTVFLPATEVIGIGLLFYGGHMLHKSWESSSWPSTEGVIRTSDAKSGTKGKNKDTSYTLEVTYDYAVRERSFTGSKIGMYPMTWNSESCLEPQQAKYRVGRKVSVFYSPADPANAVLEPGIQAATWYWPIFGCVFTVVPAIFMKITSWGINREIDRESS